VSLQAFTLGDVVRENARSFPGRNAFVCGGERIGFDRVNERVDAVAVSLSRAGIASGARVLWLAQNCHRAFETMFACAKLGAVFVPANWRQSAEEMTFTIDDARPGVVIWQEAEIGERVAKARAGARDDAVWVGLDGTGAGTWAAFVDQSAPDEPHASVSEDDMVVQMYTAAFEGRPRGALLTHRNLVTSSLQHALTQRLGWEDVHLASMPFFHILGLLNALAIFHVGARNVIVR
jgi:long-chain acyl-CoA synthetase